MNQLIEKLAPDAMRDKPRLLFWSTAEGLFTALPFVLFLAMVNQLLNQVYDAQVYIQYWFMMLLAVIAKSWAARQAMLYSSACGYFSGVELRNKVATHLTALPLSELSRQHQGELEFAINQDCEIVESIFGHLAGQLMATLGLFIASVIGLLWFEWQLALSLLLGIPFALLFKYLVVRQTKTAVSTLYNSYADTNNSVLDWLKGYKEIAMAFDRTQRLKKLKQQLSDTASVSFQHEWRAAIAPVGFMLISETGLVLFLLLASSAYYQQSADWVKLAIFVVIATRIYLPLASMAVHAAEQRFMQQALVRIDRLLKKRPVEYGQLEKRVSGHIEVRDLNFSYAEKPALTNINVTFSANSLNLIVGPSGSGKSTLLNLLCRFNQGTGSIVLDNHPVQTFSEQSLYSNLAVISQHSYFVSGTLKDNLLLADPDASESQLMDAMKKAGCSQMVARLESGLLTDLGENGAVFSGGEKQRLSIARALLSKAKVLLFDEITAALDAESEDIIMETLKRESSTRTIIMVTHRLNLAKRADSILLLEKGGLIAQGRHEKLLSEQSVYQQLWRDFH